MVCFCYKIILSTATVPVCRILNALHNLLLSPKLSSFSAAELLLAYLEPGTQNSAPENCWKIHFSPQTFPLLNTGSHIHTKVHESDKRLNYIASSTVARPVQHDKCFNIPLFLTYATCFGRQFQPLSGDITKVWKVKLRKRPLLHFTLQPLIITILHKRGNNKIFNTSQCISG